MKHQGIVVLTALWAAMVTTSALGGSLTPPAGPVASTPAQEPRTPINDQTCPGDANSTYIISQSGSYYLTGNLIVAANKYGIVINADDVTIDLNGFSVRSTANTETGIVGAGVRNNVVVRNGTVRGFTIGLNLQELQGAGAVAESLAVTGCSGKGIVLSGSGLVRGCRVFGNTGVGISVGAGSIVSDCTLYQNGAGGVDAGNNTLVTGVSSSYNTGDGINVSDGGRVENCVAYNNTSGIVGNNGVRVSGCVSRNNSGNGIFTSSAAHIDNNNVSVNGNHGISFGGNSLVTNNTCVSNGTAGTAAGIHTGASNSRIEGNNCISNDYGYQVIVSGNMITRNTASDNATANWNVASGNRCLVVAAASATAVSGNSGGTSPGSTDPNANYTH